MIALPVARAPVEDAERRRQGVGAIQNDVPAVDRFRALVMADEKMQRALAAHFDPADFTVAALQMARAAGIAFDAEAIIAALTDDVLGIDRFVPAPATQRGWPGRGWIPSAVSRTAEELAVDWVHLGGAPLIQPFFEDSVRRARGRVLNRLIRPRTPLAALDTLAPDDGRQPPDGLIFHMSRSGSTLTAQMLAADPGNIVLSEAPPLDAIVTLVQSRPDVSLADRVRLLRAMVGALGRRDAAHRCILKLDAWHTLALPLFRAAFPDTPWVYLYRDPVEVMMSHVAQHGVQTMPGALPGLFDLGDVSGMAPMDYTARVLARIGDAVLEHWHLGGGLLVNYREMPGAVCDSIEPHFSLNPDTAARMAMADAAKRDAKAPDERFASDVERKQRAATPEVRTAAALAACSYAGLETLRAKQGDASIRFTAKAEFNV